MRMGSKTYNTNNLQAIHGYVKVKMLNTVTLIDLSTNSEVVSTNKAIILFIQLPSLNSVNCIKTVHTEIVALYDITKNYPKINLAEKEFRPLSNGSCKGGYISVSDFNVIL